MDPLDRAAAEELVTAFPARRYTRSGQPLEIVRDVQQETALSVFLDGKPAAKLECSTSHVKELVLGRLFSEGVISSLNDVKKLIAEDGGDRVDVLLTTPPQPPSPLLPVDPVRWNSAEAFLMMDAFAQDHSAHNRTRGTHSAYLWRRGRLLCRREDIGRHNAFDKIVGFALAGGISLAECAVFTSGRVPTDMATKAVRARLPLLVSKAAVTDKTIGIARKYRISLIGNAREDSFEVYNDARHAAL